jgi:hypothetical protein
MPTVKSDSSSKRVCQPRNPTVVQGSLGRPDNAITSRVATELSPALVSRPAFSVLRRTLVTLTVVQTDSPCTWLLSRSHMREGQVRMSSSPDE